MIWWFIAKLAPIWGTDDFEFTASGLFIYFECGKPNTNEGIK